MTAIENLRFVLYMRKSTDSADRQVQSLDDQMNVMNELAERRGIIIIKTISESKSAKEPNAREGFNQMLDLIKLGQADGILAYAFDRLSRNPVDSANVKWLLQTKKIKHIVTQNRDYFPEDNALLLSIEDGMANEYIRKLRRDVKRGMVSKFKRGIYPGNAPIGYFNCRYDRDIKVDKNYFLLVRKMWDMLLSGKYSVPTIHRIVVEDWKMRTPKKKTTGGALISRSLVYKIFHNPFYMGIIKWGGMTQTGIHKSMVTPEEFELVQKIIKSNTKENCYKHVHAFTGLMRCPNCNCQITAETKIKNGKKYSYYYCTGRSKYIKCDQKSKRLTLGQLEIQISEQISKIAIGYEFFQIAVAIIKESKSQKSKEKKVIHHQQEKALVESEKRKDRLANLLIDGVLEAEIYQEKMKAINKEIATLKIKLKRPKKQGDLNQTCLDIFRFMNGVGETFNSADQETKRDILRSLGQKLYLKDRKLAPELAPWFLPVANFNQKNVKKFSASELKKASPRKGKQDFENINSRWCNVVKQVCKAIKEHPSPIHVLKLPESKV